ncbi:hypothetical protein COU05_01135, partial [bacterium (Candidatus Gribaldobacteria) CG10_big_fil_rev_8_21_14_0_10_37_21]
GILELNSVRANPQANKVMILLTDGKANKPNGNGYDENPADIQYALDQATEAAGLGYKIFTIGLGTDGEINQIMLTQIAQITGAKKSTGEPGYYHVPNGNTLSDIYAQISLEICHYGSISGCKYEDKDHNGSILGEKALSSWEIVLSGEMSATQTTDEQGCYSFAGLKPGNYTIAEGPNALKVPFSQIYPPLNQYQIALSEGEALTNQDFGNYLPVCGNNIVDQLISEVCDGDSQQCEAEGGYSGMMSCKQDCSGYGDCITQEECGDGVRNGNEECDGQDGVVDNYFCNQNCILEYIPFCGDNEINQPEEECDGDVPKECQTQTGYLGLQECALCLWGVCEPNEFCGDTIVNGPEVCDSNERACQANGYLGVQQCNSTCAGWEECTSQEYCGDNLKNGEEECDDGNLEDGDGCSALCSIKEESKDYCINEGDLVINEIMQNPSVVSDNYGEWFEIYNPTLREIDLKDCIFSDQGTDSFTISGALVVASKGYLVLAQSPQGQNGGFIPDYIYNKANFILDNWDDEIILTCERVEVDKVFYDDGFTFPDPSGASMNLASPYLDNNTGANWCEASSPFGLGDLGTPKVGNDVCLGENIPPELILHPASWTIANYVLGEVPPGNLFNDSMAKSGLTAFDQEDGDLTSQIVVLGLAGVDVTKTGSYTIKITVEDSAGLFAKPLYREIYIRNPGTDYPARCLWDGTYNRDCSSGCFVPDEPGQEPEPPVNQPPLITLLGANPFEIIKDSIFTDLGATSSDLEDGDLTSQIKTLGSVDTSIVGTYTLTYSVHDSGGLGATTTRQVQVQSPPQSGNSAVIRVCKIITDEQSVISDGSQIDGTFTLGGPQRSVYIVTDSTSSVPTTVFQTPLVLNADLLGNDGINDAQCITYPNLPLSNYFFDREVVLGSNWLAPKYYIYKQNETPSLNNFDIFYDDWYTVTTTDDNTHKRSNGLVDMYPAGGPAIQYDQTVVIWNTMATTTPEDTGTSEEEDDGGCSGSCGGSGYTGGAVILFSDNNVGGSGGTGGDGGSGGSGGEGDGGSSEGEDQCALLNVYLKQGGNNLIEEVRKLQLFLKDFEGFNEVEISGIFDETTLNAVLQFQEKYGDDVLGEWGLNNPTGYVYITTKNKVNEIYCQLEIPLTEEEEEVILGFKQTLGNLVAKDQESQGAFSGGRSSQEEDGAGNDQTTFLGPLALGENQEGGNENQAQDGGDNLFFGLIGFFGQTLSQNMPYLIVGLVLLLILAFVISLIRIRTKKRAKLLSEILQVSNQQV